MKKKARAVLKAIVHRLFPKKMEAGNETFPPDYSVKNQKIIQNVRKFTMTSSERINELLRATEYLIENKVEGDFVECGVWRGGSMMAVAYKLLELNQLRDIYCFDTYEGMSEPTLSDVSSFGDSASKYLRENLRDENDPIWAYSPLEAVKENFGQTKYPLANVKFIKGKVEDTIPHKQVKKIALLRLDTDWYESTRHELKFLFPLLVKGGILIIDDYGHWEGAKKAVDEYIDENKVQIFLSRVDYTGRVAVKLN